MNIKKIIQIIWQEFVYGGHLLSFGASAIIYVSAIILKQTPNILLMIIGYLLSQIVYSYDHLKSIEADYETNPDRAKHLLKFKNSLWCFFVLYWILLVVILVYIKNWPATLVVFFIITFGVLYSLKLKNFTKKIIAFKNIFTSFLWASLAILTNTYYHLPLNNKILLLLFLFIFIKFLLSTIFFDLKDIDSDKKENLKTIPAIIGKTKTLQLLQLINILSFFPLVIIVWQDFSQLFSLSLLITLPYVVYYLKQVQKDTTNINNLSYVLVDGEYMLWALIILLTKSKI